MFSMLFGEALTIKVYGAAIVCASQFFLIESFKWDVIEKTVFACRHNYNMQMLLLFTTIPHIPLDEMRPEIPGAVEPQFRRPLVETETTPMNSGCQ